MPVTNYYSFGGEIIGQDTDFVWGNYVAYGRDALGNVIAKQLCWERAQYPMSTSLMMGSGVANWPGEFCPAFLSICDSTEASWEVHAHQSVYPKPSCYVTESLSAVECAMRYRLEKRLKRNVDTRFQNRIDLCNRKFLPRCRTSGRVEARVASS